MDGVGPPSPKALPRVRDRMSFLYVERCVVSRDENALTFTDESGTVHVPLTAVASIMLGPGTSVTHKAVSMIGESGGSAIWTGENGVRMYASGRGLSRSNRLLRSQAERSANRRKRLAVARTMYQMRFPGEDVSRLTMQQLRGREGARVRNLYRQIAKETGVEWHRRDYDPADFTASDLVNQALSSANSALYGVAHSVIVGLGMSPGLGFIHEGHDLCFGYDVADLYKAKISIPAAFEVVQADAENVAASARRAVRDRVFAERLLQDMVRDLQTLMGVGRDEQILADVISLWDYREGKVRAGTNYGNYL